MKLLLGVGVGCVSKSFLLLFIVILATSSLIGAKTVFAQTPTPTPIPTPSVPQFTVQPVGPPYTVPTTYSLNQSSGQIVANIGYTNEYSAVNITIKNQHFTPYNDSSGYTIELYYNIQIKNADANNWGDLYALPNYPTQSTDSDYTNISISNIWSLGLDGTQTDIQVQAMIGYITADTSGAPYYGNQWVYSFVGQTSSWSPTQTVNVPENTPLSLTSSPSPTASPTSAATSTPTPSSSMPPTTSTPNQTASASTQNPNSIYEILIATLVALIIAFAVVIAAFRRGKRR